MHPVIQPASAVATALFRRRYFYRRLSFGDIVNYNTGSHASFFCFLFARPSGRRAPNLKRRSYEKPSPFSNPCKDLSDLAFGPNRSAKVGLENQDEKQEQRVQSFRDRQQEEKNDRNSILSSRAQPNAASYHSRQNSQGRQPGQNVE
jgi:hypothetical protein